MRARPFSTAAHDGIVTATLDTPGCAVNVFDLAAAEQLTEIVESLDPARVRALVLRSAKPGSFVNGAQLMMANTVQRPEDVPRLTGPVRRAYTALRRAPVPTLCAISGNCFGCGVELALNATYRIADDAFDTQFYMTEIADYLLLPTFGSTQDLPKLVGLDAAAELLLWGSRWGGLRAAEGGLVDACVVAGDLDARARAFVEDVMGRRTRTRPTPPEEDVDGIVQEHAARIERLPPEYRPLHREALALLEQGARGGAHYADEMRACGRSLMAPIARNALGFFFVRQLAEATHRRAAPAAGTTALSVELEGLDDLARDLRARRIRHLTVHDVRAASPDLRLVAYSHATGRSRDEVAFAIAPQPDPVRWRTDVIGYAPLFSHGVSFLEIAARAEHPSAGRTLQLARAAGFTAVITRPGTRFVVDALARAFASPVLAFLAKGRSADDAARALLEFGFVRSMPRVADLLPSGVAADRIRDARAERGAGAPELVDAVLVSLLGAASRALAGGEVLHTAAIDVIAREVLDFPLGHGSLCRYLDARRVGSIVDRSAAFSGLVAPASVDLARRYSADGRSFYH